MIVQDAFLKKIKQFGLNSYEAKIWTALLSRGVSTAGELSDIANVPRSRSYDVLESLEKKGFIMMKIGKPLKYIAIPPEEVLERVKKRIKSDAEKESNDLDKIKKSDILKDLNVLHTQGIETTDPTELTVLIKGRKQIYNHLNMMIKNAQKSIILMTTPQGLKRKYIDLYDSLEKANKKGVEIKIFTPTKQQDNQILKELQAIAEISDTQGHKGRFCLIDNKELAFMLLDDANTHPDYDLAVWVNTPLFANILAKAVTAYHSR